MDTALFTFRIILFERGRDNNMKAYQHKVQYYETDKMGITHHSNYIRWMEEARVDFLEQIGWNFDRLEEMGIISPVTAVECKYRVSTRFPELITITVEVEEFKGVKLKLKYTMQNEENVLVCEGLSEHCFLNAEGHIIWLKKEYPEFYETLVNLSK